LAIDKAFRTTSTSYYTRLISFSSFSASSRSLLILSFSWAISTLSLIMFCRWSSVTCLNLEKTTFYDSIATRSFIKEILSSSLSTLNLSNSHVASLATLSTTLIFYLSMESFCSKLAMISFSTWATKTLWEATTLSNKDSASTHASSLLTMSKAFS